MRLSALSPEDQHRRTLVVLAEPPGLVSLYNRTAELALWPTTAGQVGEHTARSAKAGLGDMSSQLAIAPRTFTSEGARP